jgi:predicted ArsR family transcriptional regulator
MSQEILANVISSKTRLKIAGLISSRPRTLRELSAETGISVQAVLKHLEKLSELGLVSEQKVDAGGIGARKVYVTKGTHIADFSSGDLTVVKLSKYKRRAVASDDPVQELEALSEDIMFRRRRIRDQARRLGRLIDEMGEDQERIEGLISSLGLTDEERLLLQVAFSEESMDDAERLVREQRGVADARRSLEKVISKAKRIAKK